jgi:hypothetical protein
MLSSLRIPDTRGRGRSPAPRAADQPANLSRRRRRGRRGRRSASPGRPPPGRPARRRAIGRSPPASPPRLRLVGARRRRPTAWGNGACQDAIGERAPTVEPWAGAGRQRFYPRSYHRAGMTSAASAASRSPSIRLSRGSRGPFAVRGTRACGGGACRGVLQVGSRSRSQSRLPSLNPDARSPASILGRSILSPPPRTT